MLMIQMCMVTLSLVWTCEKGLWVPALLTVCPPEGLAGATAGHSNHRRIVGPLVDELQNQRVTKNENVFER